MTWLLAALGIWVGGGATALAAGSSPVLATRIGVVAAVLGSLAGMVPVAGSLLGGATVDFHGPWSIPSGSIALGLDGLSAFFLLPTLVLGGLAAVYGGEYLMSYSNRRMLGVPWFLYNWMMAGLALVFVARNSILFLIGWEIMTLCAVFLVTFDDEKGNARFAGWLYLVASHIATAFILIFFIVLGRESGSLDFSGFTAGSRSAMLYGTLFVCAAIGFGTKAGIMPFHVWLPEAHPAAPSHVSAVMSGLILKTGVYGLLRGLTFLGEFQEWWGWILLGVGLTSSVLGILFALGQHDLKRLLAYSSVENIGIIFIGIGMGIVGSVRHSPVLATLGFAGALLHSLNHSLAKGMLFMNAGAIQHATGTRRMNLLGGLLKHLPWEGAIFLAGSISLCALPPMNGFLSEFWIYLGAFQMRNAGGSGTFLPSLVLLAGLALVGGLAAIAYSKAFGATFLGQPRQVRTAPWHRPGWAMRFPMLALAGLCVLMVPGFSWIAGLTVPLVKQLSGMESEQVLQVVSSVQGSLLPLAIFAGLLLGLGGFLAWARFALLRRRKVTQALTWDCGYAAPSPRMQYTGTAYSQPLAIFFSLILQGRTTEDRPDGSFPRSAARFTYVPDLYLEKFYRPFFSWIEEKLSWWRWVQHGRIQAYVLYISVTLLFLLAWKLR